VAADAGAVAAARRHRQRALLGRGLAALAQHALCQRSLPCLHAARLAAGALRCWHAQAAATAVQRRRMEAAAARHASRHTCSSALGAWQQGARRCRQERLVAQRRDARWGVVQQYLSEHQQAKAKAASKLGGDGGGGGALGCSLSSAENSFDPNTIFFGGGQ
jgi:hypothetical protein